MNLRKNIVWIFALIFLVTTAIDASAAITSARVVDVNGSTFFLNYDDNTTSYADISIENPDVLLELCADTATELLNKYVTWNYKVLDKNISVSIMPAQITAVNASNCTTVNVDLSRGKAYYPAVLSVAISDSSSMSSASFYDLTIATGFLNGNYTFNLSDNGHSQVNLTITQVLNDLLNPMITDYDYIIVGLLENGVLMESHITSINDVVTFNKYGNNYTFNINGLLFTGDLSPPMLFNLVPARRSSRVSQKTAINFDIIDNTGVNISSLLVRINNNLTNVTDFFNLTNTTVYTNDNTTNLSWHFNQIRFKRYPRGSIITVNVYVCDYNNLCLNDTYIFRIEGPEEERGGGKKAPPDPESPERPVPSPRPPLPEEIPADVLVYIYEVDVDGDTVAEDHEIIDTPVWASNSSHSITVKFKNDGNVPLEDIKLVISSPEGITVTEISPVSIRSLDVGGKAKFDVNLEAGTLSNSFMIDLDVNTKGARDSISIPIDVLPFELEPLEFIKMPFFLYPLIFLPLLLLFLRLLALNERVRDLMGNIFSMFYAVAISDESMLRRLIRERKVDDFRKIYVPHSTYMRYQAVKNLVPIVVFIKDVWQVSNMKSKYKIDDEMAHLLYFAAKRNKVKYLTEREVHDDIKRDFKHIVFINPFEKIKKGIIKIEKGAVKEIKKIEEEAKEVEQKAVKEIKKDVKIAENKIDVALHVRKSKHLEDYVKHSRERGVPDAEIKEKMLKTGWTEREVEYYLKNAR